MLAHWMVEARALRAAARPFVRVTVAIVRGSTPREVGATMLVTADGTSGSIGGGSLEYQCTGMARDALDDPGAPCLRLRRLFLGTNCGQCCGGVVEILFERIDATTAWMDDLERRMARGERAVIATLLPRTGAPARCVVAAGGRDPPPGADSGVIDVASAVLAERAGCRSQSIGAGHVLIEPVEPPDFDIVVFGAGHVGAATVSVLALLGSRILWVDPRQELLPANAPPNVETVFCTHPERLVRSLPAGAYHLVMTHSHPLDFEICHAVLQRGDFGYLGLIGSRSKRLRFENLVRQRGLNNCARLTCPIGIPGILGKAPAEIAIAVGAELLLVRDRRLRGACNAAEPAPAVARRESSP